MVPCGMSEWRNGEGVWNLPPGYWGASRGLEAEEFGDDICALGRSLWQVCGGRRQEVVQSAALVKKNNSDLGQSWAVGRRGS